MALNTMISKTMFSFPRLVLNPFIQFSCEQTFLKVKDDINVYFLVAKTTHETLFNLPNVDVMPGRR